DRLDGGAGLGREGLEAGAIARAAVGADEGESGEFHNKDIIQCSGFPCLKSETWGTQICADWQSARGECWLTSYAPTEYQVLSPYLWQARVNLLSSNTELATTRALAD